MPEQLLMRDWKTVGTRGVLPFDYLADLLEVLAGSNALRFLRMDELPFDAESDSSTEPDLRNVYREEFQRWRDAARAGEPRCDIVFLHDTDSGPDQSVFLCEEEAARGIKSTT